MKSYRVVILVLLVMIGLGAVSSIGARWSYADDPTPTPIASATVAITPARTLAEATSYPLPTVTGPSSGFWDSTTTPPAVTATVPAFFVP